MDRVDMNKTERAIHDAAYVEGWDANPCNYPFELLEIAWGIIANAGHGDWFKESDEWREAAARFRGQYFTLMQSTNREQTK